MNFKGKYEGNWNSFSASLSVWICYKNCSATRIMRTFGLPFANGKTLRKATFLLRLFLPLFYRSGLVEPVVLEGSGPRWGHCIVSNNTRKARKTAGLSSLGVHPQILADHLTLSQPGWGSLCPPNNTGTPGFSDLPTALDSKWC